MKPSLVGFIMLFLFMTRTIVITNPRKITRYAMSIETLTMPNRKANPAIDPKMKPCTSVMRKLTRLTAYIIFFV